MDWKLARAMLAQQEPDYFMRAIRADGHRTHEVAGDLAHALAWAERRMARDTAPLTVAILRRGEWVGSLVAEHDGVRRVGFGASESAPIVVVGYTDSGRRPIVAEVLMNRPDARRRAVEMLDIPGVVNHAALLGPDADVDRRSRAFERRLEDVTRRGPHIVTTNLSLARAERQAADARRVDSAARQKLRQERAAHAGDLGA